MGAQPVNRRRGRRTGGEDTRAALLDAAKDVFSERGYDHATVRAIAMRAGVDPAMVNHWFGSKQQLFTQAILRVPFNPAQQLGELLAGDVDDLGERVVRRFLNTWDQVGGGQFAALMRSVTSHEQSIRMLREFLVTQIFTKLVKAIGADQPALRANLVGSQLIGLGVTRYVLAFEPLASTDAEELVHAIGPGIQRYLTGPIS
jgi:AcrR family transcriptional regulator